MNFEKWPANACVLGVEIVSWGGGARTYVRGECRGMVDTLWREGSDIRGGV